MDAIVGTEKNPVVARLAGGTDNCATTEVAEPVDATTGSHGLSFPRTEFFL